ncbi:hypothetical protein CRE_00396 [Caenorhabditis remanei]|uniref:DUF38 domain-containing protein n=1 Tax=Caenorhabditis remanei TaxID=31234 RepID=E3LEX1_CAERE|nr:hypothetical protein CRE_00396 [Caenorhabditis remanei]
MSEEWNDQFMKQRLGFVKLLVDSEPEEAWCLFCQALPEITDEQLDAWSQSSEKNKIKETINNEPQDVAPTVSGTGNNSNQNFPTLTTIGGDVLKEIVDRVDIKTKKALRFKCKKLLNFIDEHWKQNEVHIHLDYHKVKVRILSIGEKEELKFNDRKRKLQDDDQESKSSQKCFLQETADKFEEIIQNPKTQLGKLFITCTNENDMAKNQEKLLHLIFDKIKKPICVESLKIDLSCSNALESILRKVKVGSLTGLRLYHFSTNGSDDSAVTNIIENRHWVHIKKFIVIGCAPNSRMIAFKDMTTISALLIGQGHLSHTFYGRFNMEEIAEKLMPYEELGEINRTKGMFRREDGTQLEFELKENQITFSG